MSVNDWMALECVCCPQSELVLPETAEFAARMKPTKLLMVSDCKNLKTHWSSGLDLVGGERWVHTGYAEVISSSLLFESMVLQETVADCDESSMWHPGSW